MNESFIGTFLKLYVCDKGSPTKKGVAENSFGSGWLILNPQKPLK